MADNRIYFIDVTNRDGVQTSRICLSKLQKTLINLKLNELGVYQSEMGFPVTRHETNYINANLDLADKGILHPMVLEGWIRAIPEDVDKSVELTKIEHLNLSISTSEQMIYGKFQGKFSKEDVTRVMCEAVDRAKQKGIKTVGVNAEDASRTDMDYLIQFAQAAKEHGADRFRYCDTLGFDNPFTIYDRVKAVASEVKIPIELHCHNDLGLAVANSLGGAIGAIHSGVDAYINTTINGVGERAGNADLISVILAIKHSSVFSEQDILDEKINILKAWKMAKYVSYAFDIPIPINQPGVGANAFAHESGIHADGALKDRKNYELYDFEELGLGEPEVIETGRSITVGEYSGIKGFRNVYEKLQVEFHDDREANEVLELVRYANVHNQKPIVEDELIFIAEHPDIAKKLFRMDP